MKRFFKWLVGQEHVEASELFRPRLSEAELQANLKDLVRFTEFKRLFEEVVSHRGETANRNLTILSAENQEGKTLMVSLLAFAFAELLKERVLILDTQTYNRPGSLRLDAIFEPDESVRKPHGVRGTFQLNIDLVKLSDLHAESAFGTEYRLDKLVGSLREHYDTILVDTCSLSARNQNNFDPVVLANRSDATLLLTSPRSIDAGTISQARVKSLIPSHLLSGVIFNDGGF